jgi:hypothetical protein
MRQDKNFGKANAKYIPAPVTAEEYPASGQLLPISQ